MTTDSRLEAYLTALENVLRPFPVSDRAEIVTEIKSHVLSALERDPQASLDSVLTALGEPETVANRYLMERGLQPTKPPISPMVKWIVIGGLGFFAMLLIFIGVMLFHFAPLLKVDGDKEHVSILGGVIDVDGKNGRVRIGGNIIEDGDQKTFSGNADTTLSTNAVIQFSKGSFEISNTDESKLSWECHTSGDHELNTPTPVLDKKNLTIDFGKLKNLNCDFSVPKNLHVDVRGENGSIRVEEPHFNLVTRLTHGKVILQPDSDESYHYALSVKEGKMDQFKSAEKAPSYTIDITVDKGSIVNQDEE
jgi:hypothetical protein